MSADQAAALAAQHLAAVRRAEVKRRIKRDNRPQDGGRRPVDPARVASDPLGELADAYFDGIPDAFRRPDSPYKTVEVSLRGLEPGATYEVQPGRSEEKTRITGSELMAGFQISIAGKRQSMLVTYKKVTSNE